MIGQEKVLPLGIVVLIASISDCISVSQLSEAMQKLFTEKTLIAKAVWELVNAGILVKENAPLAQQEIVFSQWVWSSEAAENFWATRRVQWLDEAAEVEVFGRLLCSKRSPTLWDEITEGHEDWQALGVDLRAGDAFQMLARRRSLRQFASTPLSSETLGAILSAGLGVQQFLELPWRPTYPLKFSPSPGGLNTFTGYVFARRVQGLCPGVYMYNGLRNQVKRIHDYPVGRLSRLFGNQLWADEAAAVCVLSADYQKMAWKYSDQSAFNSLLIESGHIAQNMMVCAATLSIGSVPTNAVDQAELERYFSLTFPHQVVLYAIAFGHDDPARERDHYSPETLRRLKAIVER